jgi:hypothetical protein
MARSQANAFIDPDNPSAKYALQYYYTLHYINIHKYALQYCVAGIEKCPQTLESVGSKLLMTSSENNLTSNFASSYDCAFVLICFISLDAQQTVNLSMKWTLR